MCCLVVDVKDSHICETIILSFLTSQSVLKNFSGDQEFIRSMEVDLVSWEKRISPVLG